MPPLLYYECISEFKKQYYSSLISIEHLEGEEIKIDKLSYPDLAIEDKANFWGWVFKKDGKKYLVPSRDDHGVEKKLKDIVPFIAKDVQKVANNGTVYHFVRHAVPAKFKPEKKMSFKAMTDILSSLEHTNPSHQKLAWFVALASMMDRVYCRISTNPGFGKDSTVDILGNLIGGAATIENPTLAKLEYQVFLKWLAVNEVVDISKTEWRVIEQFLLSAGAHKPEITKHSRATMAGAKEVLDLSRFSLSLMYNDIDSYPEQDKYFDFVTKDAVKDRYPAFRLWGRLTEDFNTIRNIDVLKFVKDHEQDYKDLIYTFSYYKTNLMRELKHYKTDAMVKDMPERWKISIGKILRIIDLYCESQEEYDEWLRVLSSSLNDYKEMLTYPKVIEQLTHKAGKGKEFERIKGELKLHHTFHDKIFKINSYLLQKSGNEKDFWGDKDG